MDLEATGDLGHIIFRHIREHPLSGAYSVGTPSTFQNPDRLQQRSVEHIVPWPGAALRPVGSKAPNGKVTALILGTLRPLVVRYTEAVAMRKPTAKHRRFHRKLPGQCDSQLPFCDLPALLCLPLSTARGWEPLSRSLH
jgi:hypothetical protein